MQGCTQISISVYLGLVLRGAVLISVSALVCNVYNVWGRMDMGAPLLAPSPAPTL